MNRILRLLAAAALAAAVVVAPQTSVPALSEEQGIVAVVNDQPITERDITERIALVTILKDVPPGGMSRKQALQSLIDERIKIVEATRVKMMPTDAEIRDQVVRMAKGMETTPDGLTSRLKTQGISEQTFTRYVGMLIGFNRVMSGKYRSQITATEAEVDAKMAEIKGKADSQMSKILSDPRMKAVTVYSLLEITLPLDGNDTMFVQGRAIEAAQVLKRFKGCGNARAAAEGIFNVKVGKKFDVDASKLPKPLKAALDKAGTGRAVGPMRGKGGIQLLALCGSRKITPPKPDFKLPTRQQIERIVINEKYDELEERFLKTLRGTAYIEYRNSSYATQ